MCKGTTSLNAVTIALAGLLLHACRDTPVALNHESADPARTELIETVRQLARDHGFRPVAPPPPVRDELVALGRALAFDRILSGNRDVACMTCHLPAMATGDGKSLTVGQGGRGLGPARAHPDGRFVPRNAPAAFNLHRLRKLMWDGRIEEMEDGSLRTPAGEHLTSGMEAVFEFGAASAQPMFPLSSRVEMVGSGNELAEAPDGDYTELWSRIMARLGAIDEYREKFEAAYPGTSFADMTFAHAANAITGFLISELSSAGSPWDRFLQGDEDRLSEAQLRGAREFMTVGCTRCHQTDVFDGRAGNEFHNAALPQLGPGKGDGPSGRDDFGRQRVTGNARDYRRFRTPPLRNIELTAPYGHAGQFATLRAFVEHYDNVDDALRAYDVSQVEPLLRPTLLDNHADILRTRDPLLAGIRLDDPAIDDLVEFLRALTDDAARDLSSITPARVPSGLPVDRMRSGG